MSPTSRSSGFVSICCIPALPSLAHCFLSRSLQHSRSCSTTCLSIARLSSESASRAVSFPVWWRGRRPRSPNARDRGHPQLDGFQLEANSLTRRLAACLLRPGMRLVVHRDKLRGAHLRVALRRRQSLVPEKLLNGAQVGAFFKQVGSEGV